MNSSNNDNKKEEDKSPWGFNKIDSKNYDKFFQDKKQEFKNMFEFRNNNYKFISLGIIVLIFFWLSTGFYKVDEGEQAVVTRLGKFVRVSQAGLNFHLPEPIEAVQKVKVERVESEEIGFTSSEKNLKSFKNQTEKSLMLTKDENIIDVNFVVQWKISDIEKYVFNVLNPQETVRSAAESAMREVIGNNPIAAPLTEGKSNIEFSAKNLLQDILDSYRSGIAIVNLRMARVDPPQEVIDSFRDVQTARSDKEREINQAQAYQNDIIPKARGEASKIIQEAEAYKHEVVSIATGEVSRFNAIYEQYKNSKQVTKQRIYIETMESILEDVDKVILSKDLGKSVLPYLSLPKISNNG